MKEKWEMTALTLMLGLLCPHANFAYFMVYAIGTADAYGDEIATRDFAFSTIFVVALIFFALFMIPAIALLLGRRRR